MITVHPMRSPVPDSNILKFALPEPSRETSYGRALAIQEMQLHDALARVRNLRCQSLGMMRSAEADAVLSIYAAPEVATSRVAHLTAREREVLELVLAGRPSKIIAWQLGIRQCTVENHRASIMRKTGSKSIPALARLAVAAGW
jgi:DNA-binding CsgD family transcriptional regulator